MITYGTIAMLNMYAIGGVSYLSEDRSLDTAMSVNQIAVAWDKNKDGVADTGVVLRPFAMATGKPVGILFNKVTLVNGMAYKVSGTVYPVDNTVYLVKGSDIDFNLIQDADISKLPYLFVATPDSEGNWSVDEVSGVSGELYCIASTPVTLDMLQTAGIKCSATSLNTPEDPDEEEPDPDTPEPDEPVDPDAPVEPEPSDSFVYCSLGYIVKGGDYRYPKITVAGECTTGADIVYISNVSSDNAALCTECGGEGRSPIQHSCTTCSSVGTIPMGTCPLCNGTGIMNQSETDYIECPECLGSAGYDCGICGGEGYLRPGAPCLCDSGSFTEDTECPACYGQGVWERSFICSTCNGLGTADGMPCVECNGVGWFPEVEWCSSCGGDGVGDLSLNDLINNVVNSADVIDGTYTLTFDGNYDTYYTAWCYGNTGTLTGGMTYVDVECLSPDTLITMSDRSRKRIVDIRPGEFVLSRIGEPTVVTDMHRGKHFCFHTKYTFEDGTVIDETHRHRFYNVEQGFWQYLDQWNIGEHAKREDGALVALVSAERIDEVGEMCGLWTEDYSYYANGLLTGETAVNKYVLQDVPVDTAAEILATLTDNGYMRLMKWESALP